MSILMDEYRDDELCAECGGKCCYVHGPPYNMNAKKLHEDKKHIYGGGNREEYGVDPLPQKIHPHACEYLSEKVLKENSIEAPIMVVKGDGCMMSEKMAREKPIETILSGPASSIIGGTFLTDTPDALVFDMGGTTTDIAILKDGVPKINQEGATVGGWLTRVQAAQIYTYGMGGDSYIQLDEDREIQVGPQRAWPLSVIAHQYPHLIDELNVNFDKSYNLMFAPALRAACAARFLASSKA
jgi:hypothetical protein